MLTILVRNKAKWQEISLKLLAQLTISSIWISDIVSNKLNPNLEGMNLSCE